MAPRPPSIGIVAGWRPQAQARRRGSVAERSEHPRRRHDGEDDHHGRGHGPSGVKTPAGAATLAAAGPRSGSIAITAPAVSTRPPAQIHITSGLTSSRSVAAPSRVHAVRITYR